IEDNKDTDLNNDEILEKLDEANHRMAKIAETKLNSYGDYTEDFKMREKINNQSNKSLDEHSNKSLQKYETEKKKLIYSPAKFRTKKSIGRYLAVGEAKKVSSIKIRMGGDGK